MHDSYSQAHEDEHLRFGLSEAERLYQHRFSAFLFENESGPQLPAQNTARTPKRRNTPWRPSCSSKRSSGSRLSATTTETGASQRAI